jgi:hypothetical protein
MRVIETHQRAQRGQAQTGALLPVGEQGLQGGQRSCVAKLPQGLDGGEAHRLLGIGEQGEQEAKACARSWGRSRMAMMLSRRFWGSRSVSRTSKMANGTGDGCM